MHVSCSKSSCTYSPVFFEAADCVQRLLPFPQLVLPRVFLLGSHRLKRLRLSTMEMKRGALQLGCLLGDKDVLNSSP